MTARHGDHDEERTQRHAPKAHAGSAQDGAGAALQTPTLARRPKTGAVTVRFRMQAWDNMQNALV